MFSEIYEPRYVNNIYFDSVEMKNYFDNVDGVVNRTKVRIRWYGDLFGAIDKPVLELKIKKGVVGKKASFLLAPFSIDEYIDAHSEKQKQVPAMDEAVLGADIPAELQLQLCSMQVALLNRYHRRYYLSADRKYRITIDSELTFFEVCNRVIGHRSVDRMNTVLELKYDLAQDRFAHRITNAFPFRLTRSSKYVNGIEMLP